MALPPPGADRTCLVTGASSGIGTEIAHRLAERGHGVTLAARRADRLEALATELSRRHGIRAEALVLDVSDADARGRVAGQLEKRGLVVDVLVNNAGLSTTGRVASADRDAEINMIRTNVEAVVDLCTIFSAGMRQRGRGAILNTASTAAFQPLPGQAGYGGTKAFVLSYSRALGAELAGSGVTVTALCPGPVKTGFGQAAGLSAEEEESALPKFMWVSAAEVARQGVEGMDKGRAVVIPGMSNAVLAHVSHHAPRRLVLKLVASQHPSLKD